MSSISEIAAWVAIGAALITSFGAIGVAIINRKVPDVDQARDDQAQFTLTVLKDNAEVRGALSALRAEFNAFAVTAQADKNACLAQAASEKKELQNENARLEREITRLSRHIALNEVGNNGGGVGAK